jgi:predicted pyridoxine 5'-phosphate oxidase superfamily flavin-nucleotide-binding protein
MKSALPEEALSAWNDREGPVVLTTVDAAGMPNSIYASIAHLTSDGRLAVCDNYFEKTRANIDAATKACLLFITRQRKSYQIKGTIDYYSSGPLYDEMLAWSQAPAQGGCFTECSNSFSGKG